MKAWIKLPRSSVGKWVSSLGLLSLAITSIDTAFAIDPTGSLSELSRTQWTSRDGAPANMWQLAQTQDGYLWVGAFSGLYRFDGERFEPFALPDGSHPLNKNISAVCATPSGDLWAGTRLGGEIYVLHDGALKKYGQEDGLPRQTVYRIRMRDDGSIWALGTVVVVTIFYRGTNPDHTFSLKWGPCKQSTDGNGRASDAEVLDSQWQDAAQQDFNKTTRFDLDDVRCRPAKLTLRTAPRYYYTIQIPARTVPAP